MKHSGPLARLGRARARILLLLVCAPVSPAQAVPLEPGWPQVTGYSVSPSAAAGQFDADPQWEIAIASQDGKVYVYNHDGTILPGWPHYMGPALGPDQFANLCSSPAIHDLDGDGQTEIVVGCYDGKVYAFRANGTLVPGWPFVTGWMVFSTPAVGELDGDPTPEIVFGSNDGGIYAVNANGTVCPGFPVHTPYVVRSSPALGDLDGDGRDEIVITADNSNYQLYGIDGDGTMLPGFPRVLWQSGAVSSPSLADLDGDGYLEIVVGARNGTLHVMRRDGTPLPGWPLAAGYSIESSPTLADLDADPDLEIVVGCNDSKVVAYNLDATLLPGWPQTTTYTVISSPSVGDLDGDGLPEIVVGENTGKVYGWHADGTPLAGFPLTDATYTIYSSPLLEDLDLDGHCELLVGCNDTKIYCWDLGPGSYNPAAMQWAKWRLNRDNDAAVPTQDPAGVAFGEDDGGEFLLTVVPNPARRSCSVSCRAAGAGFVSVRVFDPAGRLVRTLERGRQRLVWDLRDDGGRMLPAGVYMVQAAGAGQSSSRRVVVTR